MDVDCAVWKVEAAVPAGKSERKKKGVEDWDSLKFSSKGHSKSGSGNQYWLTKCNWLTVLVREQWKNPARSRCVQGRCLQSYLFDCSLWRQQLEGV